MIGEWSELRKFTTEPAPEQIVELSAPVLIAPGDSSENISTQPTFEWTPVERRKLHPAIQQIKSTDMIIDEVVSGTSFTPEIPVDDQSSYQWRVRAVNNSGTNEGKWSDQWTFTTEGTDDSVMVMELLPNLRPGPCFSR